MCLSKHVIVEKYTVNYEMIEGQTVLSSSDVIYQDVYSADMCAKLCSNYQGFDYDCKSFDYCDYLSTCYLGKTHYYDVPKADIQMTPDCTHYSSELIPSPNVSNEALFVWSSSVCQSIYGHSFRPQT